MLPNFVCEERRSGDPGTQVEVGYIKYCQDWVLEEKELTGDDINGSQ